MFSKLDARRSSAVLVLTVAALAASCQKAHVTAEPVEWPASEALATLRLDLHAAGSGSEARMLFPDLYPVFVDEAKGKSHPSGILPFRHYWSPSGRFTVGICNIDKTVFVCPYYVAGRLTPADYSACDVDPTFLAGEKSAAH